MQVVTGFVQRGVSAFQTGKRGSGAVVWEEGWGYAR